MTGYGRAEGTRNGSTLVVELKTVNHRFFEPSIRLPKLLSNLEETVKKTIQARIMRGRVELSTNLSGNGIRKPHLDLEAARAHYQMLKTLQEKLHLPGQIDITMLSSLQGMMGVVEPSELSAAALSPLFFRTLNQALSALEKMRKKEGAALEKEMIERLNRLVDLVNQIRQQAGTVVGAYHERLKSRVEVLSRGLSVDPNRLAQEVALFADRSDMSEEITRLEVHLTEFRKTLKKKESVGRTLDFLLQEMNRETNTIGSKANDTGISLRVVEMKSELEKIREQVQNIE